MTFACAHEDPFGLAAGLCADNEITTAAASVGQAAIGTAGWAPAHGEGRRLGRKSRVDRCAVLGPCGDVNGMPGHGPSWEH